jgi:hypothetical protein
VSAKEGLLTILSLGHGYDADPAHPRLCRPGCGLGWWADQDPVPSARLVLRIVD